MNVGGMGFNEILHNVIVTQVESKGKYFGGFTRLSLASHPIEMKSINLK